MIVAKIIGTAWMLLAFWFCLVVLIRGVNTDIFGVFDGLLSVSVFWLLIGLVPVALAKFAWRFIG